MDYDLGYDLEEALKREGISHTDLNSLRDPHVDGVPKNVTDKQLAHFLNACGSLSEARKCLKLYYAAKKNAPEHFDNRDPITDQIQQCFKCQDYFHLPMTPDGYQVIFHRLSSSKAGDYHFDHAIKTFFMTIDSCMYELGPRPGIIFIFDMKGVGLTHLTRVRVSSIRKFFHYLQECLPAKLKAIHILNVVGFFDKILSLIRPFMRAEIFKMMHLHTSSLNLEKFHTEHIPKSCLPSDFGGDLVSVKELHQQYIGKMEAKRKYFIAEEMEQRRADTFELIDDEQLNTKMKKIDFD